MFLNSPQTSTFDVYDHSLAIEYYSNYLQNVSPYSDFPIHQLIGRRGQAPPEVQRVAVNAMDLKMFLSRYPSIFTVTENNCVRLVKTIADCRNPKQKTESKAERPGGSDEAVEYYLKVMKKKLSSCDSTTCIPIKNLIGYRSQAPPAVQNCARNIHELVTLLSNHPETFRVFRGRLVALKQPSPVVAVRKEDQNQAPKLKYDENDSALAVEYYSNILKKSIPDYSISRLIGHRGQAPLEVQKVAYTDRDLKLFLSKFPNIFCLNGDIVTLKKSPPVLDSLKERSDIKSGGYTDDQIQNVAVKFYADVLRDRGFCGIEVPIQKLTGYGSTAPLEVQNCARNPKELYELFSKYPKVFSLTKKKGVILIEPPLDNIAPIMKNLTLNSDINSNSTKAVDYYVNIIRSKIPNSEIPIAELKCDLVQAPVDVIREARNIEELINFFSKHPKIFTVIQNQFVKLVETSTNSNTIVQKTKLKPIKSIKNLKADQKVEPIRYFPILEYPKEPAFSGSWEDHVLDNTVLVTEVDECLEACEAIKKEKIIALDCEGFNLGSGIISLIQIALVNGTVYIFDIYELPRMITLGLKEIIESDKILKVINYCRNDALNLKMQYDVNMNYIFDVSIAFHVVENKMLTLSNFKAPGFNQMCSKYGVPTNSCKDDLKFVYITQPKYWLIRPLNIKMVSYAAFDVASLVPYLYCEFLKRMDQETESAVWRLSQRMCIT